jgi:hypothetical protein
MNSKTEKGNDEVCFTLKGALEAVRLFDIPDDALRIISVVAYSLDIKYYKHVFICARGSEVEVTINNEHINHIDTCRSACMDAFELLKRNQEGYVSACHDSCRKTIKEDAYKSLYATHLKLKEELERMGYSHAAEFDEEHSLRVTVRF